MSTSSNKTNQPNNILTQNEFYNPSNQNYGNVFQQPPNIIQNQNDPFNMPLNQDSYNNNSMQLVKSPKSEALNFVESTGLVDLSLDGFNQGQFDKRKLNEKVSKT